MITGFWKNLTRPIVGLSPMDGVTDAPWRKIAKKYGKADVIYTEFVSVDGLVRIAMRGEWDHKIWQDLKYTEEDRPVVAQIFGSDPEMFYWATKLICALGFDGVDINMGCPSPGLEKRGGGAGLIRRPDLAANIVEETNRAVVDYVEGLTRESKYAKVEELMADARKLDVKTNRQMIPVSLKTRLGSREIDRTWWNWVANLNVSAVALHGRTFKQLYSGDADWTALNEAAKIIKEKDKLFLANGDIQNIDQSDDEIKLQVGSNKILMDEAMDGILIGRGAMGRPWVLRKDGWEPNPEERLNIMIEHSEEFEKHNANKHFFAMRKHLVAYVSGFEGAGDLRKALVQTNTAQEVVRVVEAYKTLVYKEGLF